jgi:tellurite resistance protein TehA-like permease
LRFDPAALAVDWTLWTGGALLGLVTAVWIPYLMMTSHRIRPDGAFGGWSMPVVPPMVSAATGAALIPTLPAGQARLTKVKMTAMPQMVALFNGVAAAPSR